MPFRIVRNDITKMHTEAIVNTANAYAIVGSGCDRAVYDAAGYHELLKYRTEKIGYVEEGKAFITPGFRLSAKFIVHTISPLFKDGKHGEEKKLRSCYRNSLQLAKENGIRSIAIPLISTGSFGYPKEEGMRIAVDEINAFLLGNEMDIFLVVFDRKATELGRKLYPDLETYIDGNYVNQAEEKFRAFLPDANYGNSSVHGSIQPSQALNSPAGQGVPGYKASSPKRFSCPLPDIFTPLKTAMDSQSDDRTAEEIDIDAALPCDSWEMHQSKLEERMKHLSDTYSQYLMYLIHERNMENAEVYKRAIVDKKTFSKIKNNVNYHPNRLTALCLCVGAKLNLDETRDLLARAGYALSPCDKTDVIFSYFIENEIYDMIELDIQLEEHGLPCIIQ